MLRYFSNKNVLRFPSFIENIFRGKCKSNFHSQKDKNAVQKLRSKHVPEVLPWLRAERSEEESQDVQYQPGGWGEDRHEEVEVTRHLQAVKMCEDPSCPWPFNEQSADNFVIKK